MISDFLLRADVLTPSASAIAISWALSFDSRTDCSSACAVTLTFSLKVVEIRIETVRRADSSLGGKVLIHPEGEQSSSGR